MKSAIAVLLLLITQDVPRTSSIEGSVVDAVTQKPIMGARVSPFPVAFTTTTDAAGHFRLQNLQPGQRQITARASGYSTIYMSMSLTPGESMKDVTIRLQRYGVVSGRILDSMGQPAVRAVVQLMEYRWAAGNQTYRAAAGQPETNLGGSFSNTTDDQGNFRIYDVSPGEYHIRAEPPSERIDVKATLGVAYYPGVTNPETATAIRVTPGSEVQLSPMTLVPSTLGWINVRVVDESGERRDSREPGLSLRELRTGTPVQHTSVSGVGVSSVRPDKPGRYVLCAQVGVIETNVVTPFGTRDGCVAIDYLGNEMEVAIRIGRPDGRLTAFVRLEDADGSSPQRFELSLSGWTEHQAWNFNYRMKDDGTLNVSSSPISNSGLGKLTRLTDPFFPADYYVASVRQGNRDVLRDGFYIPPNADSPIEIVVSAAGGLLRGRVMDASGKPVPSSEIVLVPQEILAARSDRGSTYRTAQADQNGVYEIRGLIPGQYRAYAVPNLDGFAFWDSAYTKVYIDLSKSVQIEKHGRISADLTLINSKTP